MHTCTLSFTIIDCLWVQLAIPRCAQRMHQHDIPPLSKSSNHPQQPTIQKPSLWWEHECEGRRFWRFNYLQQDERLVVCPRRRKPKWLGGRKPWHLYRCVQLWHDLVGACHRYARWLCVIYRYKLGIFTCYLKNRVCSTHIQSYRLGVLTYSACSALDVVGTVLLADWQLALSNESQSCTGECPFDNTCLLLWSSHVNDSQSVELGNLSIWIQWFS